MRYSAAAAGIVLAMSLSLLAGCRSAPADRGRQTESAIALRRAGRLDYRIAPWYGDRTAACSVTFDDGTLDQYLLAFPELEQRGLDATFFLITGPRETGLWNDNGTLRQLFSWEHAREIAEAGHEIASHSVTHRDLSVKDAPVERELVDSMDQLLGEIPSTRGLVFGWPYWRSSRSARRRAHQYYIGARTGGGFVESYLDGEGIPGHTPPDLYGVNSLGALLSAENHDWIGVLDRTLEQGGWLVAGFHGVDDGWIGDRAMGWQAMPVTRLRSVLDYLVAMQDLWIAPFGDVVRYVRERDAARLRLREATDRQWVVELTDRLSDEIYDQPLTVKLTLPEDWREVVISQGSVSKTARRDSVDGTVTFDALPDGNPITLRGFP